MRPCACGRRISSAAPHSQPVDQTTWLQLRCQRAAAAVTFLLDLVWKESIPSFLGACGASESELGVVGKIPQPMSRSVGSIPHCTHSHPALALAHICHSPRLAPSHTHTHTHTHPSRRSALLVAVDVVAEVRCGLPCCCAAAAQGWCGAGRGVERDSHAKSAVG